MNWVPYSDNTKNVTEKELQSMKETNKATKKKRIKQVFTSSMVAHVWAQQTQYDGRNAQGNIYFRGDSIYSYGSHYLMGKIHEVNGKRVALINEYSYSPTTVRHRYHTIDAVRGLIQYFLVPNPNDINAPENLQYFKDKVNDYADSLLKKSKVDSKETITRCFEILMGLVSEANEFAMFINESFIGVSTEKLDAIESHLKKRLARYKELNTPEMIAKREAKRQANAEKKLAEAIKNFRQGTGNGYIYDLPYALLRIQGNDVRTSRGATVPVKLAKLMLTKILKGENVIGRHLGSFTVNAISDAANNDKVLTIGCHKILLSEAVNVLGNV